MSVSTSRSSSAHQTAETTPRSSPISQQTFWTKGMSLHDLDYHYGGVSEGGRGASDFAYPSSSSADEMQAAAALPNNQWWEHVLPPGQLAERLRRAQISTDPRSVSTARRFKQQPLASATPSERKVWRGFPELDRADSAQRRRNSINGGSRSSGSGSSVNTSAETSGDEASTISWASQNGDTEDAELLPSTDRTWSSFARSQQQQQQQPRSSPRSGSTRRSRVMSEDGLGLGTGHAASQVLTSTVAGRMTSHQARLRHFGHSGFVSPTLSDTPEVSSNDESDDRSSSATATTTTTTTTTTTRHSRTVSMTATTKSSQSSSTPPTILRSHFDRSEEGIEAIYEPNVDPAVASSRTRHVSFNGDLRNPAQSKRHSSPALYYASAHEYQPARDARAAFEGFASRSNSTRRSRHGVRPVTDRQSLSFSAPVSRRSSMQFDGFAMGSWAADTSSSQRTPEHHHHHRSSSIPDIALMDGLHVAQHQLATAGNLAVTLTRQLSAPLRPVFHLTLFLSISSITLVSLTCFLAAGYLLTAWDDVSARSRRVGAAAGNARKSIEATVTWGVKMLGSEPQQPERHRPHQRSQSPIPPAGPAVAQTGGESDPIAAEPYDIHAPSSNNKARSHFAWPIDLALSCATAVAFRVIPSPITGAFGFRTDGRDRPSRPAAAAAATSQSGTARNVGRGRTASESRLPPRPPLSLLLPSILFTLLIALGAGLASFFASRRAAASASAAMAKSDVVGSRGDDDDNDDDDDEYQHLPSSSATMATLFSGAGEPVAAGGSAGRRRS
ncbi:hypothetical protein ACQY0O_004748 [Thecaphora frezii]